MPGLMMAVSQQTAAEIARNGCWEAKGTALVGRTLRPTHRCAARQLLPVQAGHAPHRTPRIITWRSQLLQPRDDGCAAAMHLALVTQHLRCV